MVLISVLCVVLCLYASEWLMIQRDTFVFMYAMNLNTRRYIEMPIFFFVGQRDKVSNLQAAKSYFLFHVVDFVYSYHIIFTLIYAAIKRTFHTEDKHFKFTSKSICISLLNHDFQLNKSEIIARVFRRLISKHTNDINISPSILKSLISYENIVVFLSHSVS